MPTLPQDRVPRVLLREQRSTSGPRNDAPPPSSGPRVAPRPRRGLGANRSGPARTPPGLRSRAPSLRAQTPTTNSTHRRPGGRRRTRRSAAALLRPPSSGLAPGGIHAARGQTTRRPAAPTLGSSRDHRPTEPRPDMPTRACHNDSPPYLLPPNQPPFFPATQTRKRPANFARGRKPAGPQKGARATAGGLTPGKPCVTPACPGSPTADRLPRPAYSGGARSPLKPPASAGPPRDNSRRGFVPTPGLKRGAARPPPGLRTARRSPAG